MQPVNLPRAQSLNEFPGMVHAYEQSVIWTTFAKYWLYDVLLQRQVTSLLFHSELLCQNTGLTVSILDALSNLSLRPDLLAEVSHINRDQCVVLLNQFKTSAVNNCS